MIKIFHDAKYGMTWAERIICTGERYGVNDALVHTEVDPLVEFFDTRFEFTDLGQFVSRYKDQREGLAKVADNLATASVVSVIVGGLVDHKVGWAVASTIVRCVRCATVYGIPTP